MDRVDENAVSFCWRRPENLPCEEISQCAAVRCKSRAGGQYYWATAGMSPAEQAYEKDKGLFVYFNVLREDWVALPDNRPKNYNVIFSACKSNVMFGRFAIQVVADRICRHWCIL